MKTFLIVERGSGTGCDYTIGCNLRAYERTAPSLSDLMNELQRGASLSVDEAYRRGEYKLAENCDLSELVRAEADRTLYELVLGWEDLASVTIYETTTSVLVPVNAWGAERRARERKREKETSEVRERELYEKLAKKYGR